MMIALLWACGAEATPPAEPVAGPLRIGMPLDQARAAIPSAAWTEQRSKYTNKVIALKAAQAIVAGGRAFDVEITPKAYDTYEIVLERSEVGGSFKDCRKAAIDLVADLERRFGAFHPMARAEELTSMQLLQRSLDDSTEHRRLPGGIMLYAGRGPDGIVKAGQASRLDYIQDPMLRDAGSWHAARQSSADLTTVSIGAGYGPTLGAPGQTCEVTAVIAYRPPRPEFDTVAAADLKLKVLPTIARKHNSLEGVSLPPAGLEVAVDCRIERGSGALACHSGEAPQPGSPANAALDQSAGYLADTTALNPDSDVPLRTRLTIRLDPADRKNVSPPPEAQILPWSAVKWVQAPRKSYLQDMVTRTSMNGSVTGVCVIQADGSLICPSFTADPVGLNHLVQLGQNATSLYRAAEQLVDGSPAAGRWVRFKLKVTTSQ